MGDDDHRNLNKLIVTIEEARNLKLGTREVCAVCHLLPDPLAVTSAPTRTIKDSVHPVFREEISFICGLLSPDQEIHISLWDVKSHLFLGHITISVGNMGLGGKLDPRWRCLLPRPHHFAKDHTASVGLKSGSDIALYKSKDFIRQLQAPIKQKG